MPPLLDTSARPLLSCSVTYCSRDGEVLLDAPDDSYCFTGQSAETLSRLLPRLDGSRDIDTLASEAGLNAQEVIAHLDVLAADELVLDLAGALNASTSAQFMAAYFRECRFRSRDIFTQPFWTALLGGEAPHDLVLGWGVEFYHYVEGANEHMASSVAHCRHDPVLRRWLAEHYVEEHNHSEIFLAGLAACGLDPRQVRDASPLPSTRSLINYLTELASSDSIAYTGAFGVMQAAGDRTTRHGIDQLYDRMSAYYPSTAGLFDAVRKHALIDVELDHQELVLQRVCARVAEIDPTIARRVMRAVIDTVEHFILFFEGIHDYYARPGVLIPRRAVDIRTLL